MKYSILLPYYKRPSLQSAFVSFLHHYGNRTDYEIVIAEDLANSENEQEHTRLLDIIQKFKYKLNIIYCLDGRRSYNSARKYNQAFLRSTGEYIILSNPETVHENNILGGLDGMFGRDPNLYVVCACKSMFFDKDVIDTFEEINNSKFNMWFQHTGCNNRKLHFCSALSRNNYRKAGGFDERYCNGIAFEDDSFLKRVSLNGIPVAATDDLIAMHVEHGRTYCTNQEALTDINRKLFAEQCRLNDFFEPNEIRKRPDIKYVSRASFVQKIDAPIRNPRPRL